MIGHQPYLSDGDLRTAEDVDLGRNEGGAQGQQAATALAECRALESRLATVDGEADLSKVQYGILKQFFDECVRQRDAFEDRAVKAEREHSEATSLIADMDRERTRRKAQGRAPPRRCEGAMNLKTTHEERAAWRESLKGSEPTPYTIHLLDDLDTLTARVAQLEGAIVQIRDCLRAFVRTARETP